MIYIFINMLYKDPLGTGEVAKQLRVLATLPGNLRSISSDHAGQLTTTL